MVGKEDKASDIYSKNLPTFENKLLYCKFVNKYANDYELAAGYEDAADIIMTDKSKEELEALYRASMASEEANTDYEKGFRSAIKDYIKEKWENGNI